MAGKKKRENLAVNNQFLLGNANEKETLGINLQKHKFPQYAVVSKRFDSFKAWPEYLPLNPDVLVEAGLVYTGVGDSVRCYHCGGGLRNWEEGDVPFEEHAKWYPTCPHVLLVKGQNYVDTLLRGEKPDQDGASASASPVKPSVDDLINSAAAQSCVQMGFPETLVVNAIQRYQGLNNNAKFTGTQLCEILFEMEENTDREAEPVTTKNPSIAETEYIKDSKPVPETTSTDNLPSEGLSTLGSEDLTDLLSENQRLKENQMCKICIDDVANVIFLPCGHMVSCPQCAPALAKCPICRNSVKGYVKAYFGILDK